MAERCCFIWGYGFVCEKESGHSGQHRAVYNDTPLGREYVYAPVPSSPDEAAIDSLAVALGVESSPAVPERREMPCPHGHPARGLTCGAECAPIDWESRCRQVEAERDEARRALKATLTERDELLQRPTSSEAFAKCLAELTEARSARERAERVLMQVDAAWVDLDMAIRPNRVGDVLTPWGLGARHVLDKLRAALTPPVPPSATPDEVKE